MKIATIRHNATTTETEVSWKDSMYRKCTSGDKCTADQHELSAANTRRPRILLVEDCEDVAQMLSILLILEGYEVQIAPDMTTGLEAALQHGYDLVLSDLGLPDGCGADLMSQLRRRGRSIPGIAVSGYGQAQDVRRSLQAGFAAHLIKPVEFHQLKKTISAVLRQFASQYGPVEVPSPISLTTANRITQLDPR